MLSWFLKPTGRDRIKTNRPMQGRGKVDFTEEGSVESQGKG